MIRPRTVWLVTLIVLAALLAGSVVALAFLPELVRKTAIWRLEALTQRRVTIERVELNLFTGHVAVHGLRVDERAGAGVLAKVDRIELRIHRRSLLRLHVWIDELTLAGTQLRVIRLSPTRFNISDLLERPAAAGSSVAVTIDRLRVADSKFFFEDRTLSPTRTWTVEQIEIDGRALSTTDAGGSLQFRSIAAGAPILLRAEELRLVPYHVRAQVTVANVDLGLLRLYLPGDAAVLPERGILAAGVSIVHDAREGIRVSAGARVRNLALGRRGQEGVFAVSPEITVSLTDLVVKGTDFSVARAELEGDLGVVEALHDPPLLYDFTKTHLVVEDLAWPARHPGRITFTGGLPGGAGLDVRGTLAGDASHADLNVRALRLPLELANRYARLTGTLGGLVDVDARVQAWREQQLRLTVGGSAGATRLVVADPARPGDPPLGVERLDASRIEYEWPSRVSIGLLALRRPWADLQRDAAGALSLLELFARRPEAGTQLTPAEPAAAPAMEVSLGELRVQEGAVTLPPRLRVEGIGLVVKNATWPARGLTEIALDVTSPGVGTLRVAGDADVAQRTVRLKITARDLDVAQAQPYLPFRGRVQGRVEADLEVAGRLEPFRARVRGALGLRDAVLADGGRQLLTLARLDVTGIDFRAPARLSVDDVRIVRPFALIDRDERGQLSLAAALAAPPAPVSPLAVSSPTADLVVKHLLIEDAGTNIVDDSVAPAARLSIRGTRLEARDVTWPVRTPAKIELASPMPRGGRLEAKGTLEVEPFRLDGTLSLAEVALASAQPYLPIAGRLSGKVSSTARIAARLNPFTLSVRGDAAVKEVVFGDANRQLLTTDRVRAEGIDVQWPGGVRVARVEIAKPWVLVEREENGRFPLVDLLRPRARAEPVATPAGDPGARSATDPLRFEVGVLSLTDGFGRFVDRTTDPDFAEEISALNLTVQGLGNTPDSRAVTILHAILGPSAPLSITGRLGAVGAPLSVDALFTLSGYAAPRADAYLETLFGWRARQGRLTLALRYQIEGDKLEAHNDVAIAGLQLDRAVARAKRPKWPIGMPLDTFVSLLKDSHNDIDLSLPVHGRLSSPEFELGDAIWSALRGLAVKVVALPFALIGRLFFSPDSQIEALSVNPVTFVAATAMPAPGMAAHLDQLGTFLKNKPAIRLQLRPVLTLSDVEPLKRQALRERLQARAKEDGEAAMRAQALRLYARRFPKREPPAALDALLAALVVDDRAPAAAEAALGAARLHAVREGLAARGVDARRLVAPGSAPAVESEGTGRVEFEITQ